MRKSLLKLLWIVVASTLSTYVSAVGMGGINVASALGQPLKADIELVAVNKAEKTSLVARLASPDIYKGTGLEYPYGNKFRFQVESRANGEPYLKVSSAQPINDPFVSLLVEITWSSGKLLREYTFLLDPPDYVAEQPKPVEVQAVAPAVQAAPPDTAAEPVEQVAPVATAPIEKPAEKPMMAAPAKSAAAKPAEKNVVSGNITVHRGDTLNKIAMQNKPAEVSLERMLVALYRANAGQFDGKNMNRIRAGKVLRLPDQSELMGVAQSDAAKEIRAHTADWNTYRQKLASAAPAASQPQEAQQVATGKIASSVADKAPVAKETAKEVLKLSKGEAPGDKAATGAMGKTMTAQDKKNAAQEDAIAKDKALREEQTRAVLLEKNLKDMQRLAQLKSEAAALVQSSGAVSAVAAVSSVAAVSEVKPAPVVKPKPKPQPVVVPQPSMMNQILGEPLYLAGGAVILLGLGGLGFILSRRKQTPVTTASGQNEDAGSITGRITAPAAPSPDTGDFTSATGVHAAVAPDADDVDPISEADLFLNFGRDAQAEEILKEALQNTPNNHQIHLKLLGIYANRKDVNSFSTIARKLKDSDDETAWQQAAAMGYKLEPNNPIYSGAGAAEDTGSATMQASVLNAMPDYTSGNTAAQEAAPDVDFDLGDAETTSILSTDDKAAAQVGNMDFDVTSTNPSLHAPAAMDFDITSTSPSMPAATGQTQAASPPNLDDLIFDITSTHPPMPAVSESAKTAQTDDGGMEFILDFPVEDTAKKSAPSTQPSEAGFAGISLNLDGVTTPAGTASEAKDEHWHEVATKLDLAKAYQEMGDATGAREILDEVLREGDEGQREAAQSILDQLG